MPSGAKKRKAARKKKEKEAHGSNNNNKPLGNGDPRSQDEKDSDGNGDGGSPASHDNNNHQHSFDEGNGESGSTCLSPGQSVVADKPIIEGTGNAQDTRMVAADNENALKIHGELNVDKRVVLDVIQIDFSSSSASSSSDDDCPVNKVKTDKEACNVDKPIDHGLEKVIEVTAKDSPQEAKDDLLMGSSSVIDSVKAVLSEFEETIHVTEVIAAETSVASDVGKSSLNEEKESLPPRLEEVSEVSSSIDDLQTRGNADNLYPKCDEKGNDSKILPSSDSPATQTCKTKESPKDSKIPECSEEKPHVHSVPPPVGQRTSWLSCCGLFDVLTGSSR